MEFIQALNNGFQQGIIFFPVVLSLALSYRLLKFPDITIEGTFALGSAVFATVLLWTESLFISILVSCFAGMLAGGITAILHSYLKINKFLAGILVVTGLYSILIRILNGSNVSIIKIGLTYKYNSTYLFLAAVFVCLVFFRFYNSAYGIKLRGSALNPTYSKSIGFGTGGLLVIGLALNNLVAALSGIFFTLESNFSDIKIGQGILIVALAALAIGERIIPQNKIPILLYVILSAFVGSIFYQVLWAFALKLNIKPSDLKLLSALIVVLLFMLKRRKTADDVL